MELAYQDIPSVLDNKLFEYTVTAEILDSNGDFSKIEYIQTFDLIDPCYNLYTVKFNDANAPTLEHTLGAAATQVEGPEYDFYEYSVSGDSDIPYSGT